MVAMVAALPRNCRLSANSCRNSSSATFIRSLRSRRSLMRTEASAISVSVFAIGSLLRCGRFVFTGRRSWGNFDSAILL